MMINYLTSDIEVLTVTEMKVSRDYMSGSLTQDLIDRIFRVQLETGSR
jgi:hypothetical protein